MSVPGFLQRGSKPLEDSPAHPRSPALAEASLLKRVNDQTLSQGSLGDPVLNLQAPSAGASGSTPIEGLDPTFRNQRVCVRHVPKTPCSHTNENKLSFWASLVPQW